MVMVELLPAYMWDCPDCGRENFQRTVSFVLDPDDEGDAETIREMTGDDPDPMDVHRMTMAPERVTCRHCAAEFKAQDCGGREVEEGDE